MNKDSTLYWSHLSDYESCPQLFLWKKGWDGIDLGYGDGKPKPNPSQSSRHHAVMGSALQYAIEKMYNDEMYRQPTTMLSLMLELAEKEFDRQASKPYNRINYNEANMSRSDMLEQIFAGIRGYLQTMKAHRFLGPFAKAELDMLGWIDKWNPVGGKADVVIRRDDNGVTILDGKNSKYRMQYTDPDQLRWYALLFKLAYREMPNQLGFVMYRFPYGMVTKDAQGNETVETGVEWVTCTEDEVKALAQRALDAKRSMMKGVFDPNPSPSNCKLCDYQSVCEARQNQKKENAAKRPRKPKMEIDTESGFIDLTFK